LVPGDYVVIAVRDTGVGIEPTVVRRIFDPFFSAGRQGSGLELTIVARNVKGHGGAVEVDSAPGQGSTFRAYLPAATAAATGQPVFDAVYPSGDGDFVMLVDDDRSLLELGEEVIARLGYEPIGYADPFEALQAFSSDPRRFDLVIVDDGLPDINGLDLIRRMRAYRADIPAILVSSDQRESLIRQARDAGVFGPMFKPLRRGEVARGIAAALGRSAAGELHP
jgi:CheY-like chemotaxis protein